MARRAPGDEQPYRPLLDPGVVSAAMTRVVTQAAEQVVQPRVIELARPEPTRVTTPQTPGVTRGQTREPARGQPPSQPFAGKFDQEKRILFTRPESQAIDRLVTSLATRLNAQVKVSHVMRALVTLLLNAEAEVDRRAAEAGPLVRPPNGDARALQQFEREIARIIAAGLRDAGPVK